MDESRDIPLEKQIDAYLKGRLSKEEVDDLWIKLFKQPDYIPLLQTEIDVTRVYRSMENRKRVRHNYWKWIAAAAAVALLAVSINFFLHNQQKGIQQWARTPINLVDNLSTAQVTRSAAKVSVSDSLLNAGFKAAISGNIKQAKAIYLQILTDYNEPRLLSKVRLNVGILFYNSGNFRKSIQNFDAAIAIAQNENLLKERAYWFTGNAYININQLQKARAAIQEAYSNGKIYKKEASELLKRLDAKLGNTDLNDPNN